MSRKRRRGPGRKRAKSGMHATLLPGGLLRLFYPRKNLTEVRPVRWTARRERMNHYRAHGGVASWWKDRDSDIGHGHRRPNFDR